MFYTIYNIHINLHAFAAAAKAAKVYAAAKASAVAADEQEQFALTETCSETNAHHIGPKCSI